MLYRRLCPALAQGKETQICKFKVDVGFILDSSGSLKDDYQREKDFLKSLAGSLGFGPGTTRAGVITFSYHAEHSIKLKDFDSLTSFNNAVDKIPLMGFTTRIDKALRLAQKEMYTVENGARKNVPKILILLTDGSQSKRGDDVEEPKLIADILRSKGIRLVVIGIGSGVKQDELENIAGGQENVYSAASFDQLLSQDFVDQVTVKECEAGKLHCSICLLMSVV